MRTTFAGQTNVNKVKIDVFLLISHMIFQKRIKNFSTLANLNQTFTLNDHLNF